LIVSKTQSIHPKLTPIGDSPIVLRRSSRSSRSSAVYARPWVCGGGFQNARCRNVRVINLVGYTYAGWSKRTRHIDDDHGMLLLAFG